MTTKQETHMNFMGGMNFKLFNPIDRLKLPLLSSFIGEPSYYMPAKHIETPKHKFDHNLVLLIAKKHFLIPEYIYKSRQQVFYEATNAALDYDFAQTLKLAKEARLQWGMRKGPAQVLAIAASHIERARFNESNPNFFRTIVKECCVLPGDMQSILDAWKALHGSKSKFPSCLKRGYNDRLSVLTPYHAQKYRKPVIDAVRISHPCKNIVSQTHVISDLMKNGTLDGIDEKDIKWETHRSMGKSWLETLDTMEWRLPHMAALRNIRGFAASSDIDETSLRKYMQMVVDGVEGGKQFPFRYISAYKAIEECKTKSFDYRKDKEREPWDEDNEDRHHRKQKYTKKTYIIQVEFIEIILEYLEKCLQKSIENFPQLDGSVAALSDNSGSAWGHFTSSYGKVVMAEIGNLSALFTAYRAKERGVVYLFGDEIHEYVVDKNRPLLVQYNEITALGKTVGKCTENGVWLFFKNAFKDKTKFDHWFCYSDMQVGHGCLFGKDAEIKEQGFGWNFMYIDIHKLVAKYRMEINPRLNTYMVQTAGYTDTILPQSTYRGAVLTGWTGNEVVYAKELCKLWDQIENICV